MSKTGESSTRKSKRSTAGKPPGRFSYSKYSEDNSIKIKEIELKKLEELQRIAELKNAVTMEKLKAQAEIVNLRASIETKKLKRSCSNASYASSLNSKDVDGDKGLNVNQILPGSESIHEKVNSWLNDNTKENLEKQELKMMRENEVETKISRIVQDFTSAMEITSKTFENVINRQNMSKPKEEHSSFHSRDLPVFSGNIEDWPMFISFFKRSTERNKISEEENVIRLQKALKGDAMEAVRALFVSTRNLPTILNVLESRFGRPELIMESLIQKVHTHPTVKEENPNSLIEFHNRSKEWWDEAEGLKKRKT